MRDPIGIFDSGVGGLTVAKEIAQILPNRDLIYFGDIAHLPYGDKSRSAIQEYSTRICDFLIAKNCNDIVIACNTASAFAYQTLRRKYPEVNIYNVIDPVAKYVATNFKSESVGVIGTKGTIGSRIYPKKIKAIDDSISVKSLATPLFVPLIEEGLFKTTISKAIIKKYLSVKSLSDIKCLILGCTHYPMIQSEIQEYYKGNVEIINSAKIVAQSISEYLEPQKGVSGSMEVFVSDTTTAFEKNARRFFGSKINLTKVDL
ncbi:MAG: glutamate racemase [Flavobacteriales bacterium]|nr:glutamate racemase [Flavobacteriales bacterium]